MKDWEIEFDREFVRDNGAYIEPSFIDPNGDVNPVKAFIRQLIAEERKKYAKRKILPEK